MDSDVHPTSHRHGWDCFRTSGGYTNAFESHPSLADRIEAVYRTAYRTGYRNGRKDERDGADNEEDTVQ